MLEVVRKTAPLIVAPKLSRHVGRFKVGRSLKEATVRTGVASSAVKRREHMFEWVRRGRVAWIFPDYFDSDGIVGSQIQVFDPERLRHLAMGEFDPNFAEKVKPGDFFVGGRRWRSGHGPVQIAMKALGIAGVIAESFGREFPDGAANSAYPLFLPCPDITKKVNRWEELEVDFKAGLVKKLSSGEVLEGSPMPQDLVEVFEAGGLVALYEKRFTGRVTQVGRSIHF